MRKLLLSRNPLSTDIAALLLRVGIGGLMLFGHGLGKFQKLMAGGEIRFVEYFGLPASVNLGLAVFAEFFCAILIILGLKTRLASIPLAITMFIAAFVVHVNDAWFQMNAAEGSGSKEFALLYLIPVLALFFLGSGKYSIDALIDKS